MAQPADQDLVVTALRLGWTLAEVRGRNRLYPPPIVTSSFTTEDHALPLRAERDPQAQSTEAQVVLGFLAHRLGVDNPNNAPETFPARLKTSLQELDAARLVGGQDVKDAWGRFATLIFDWDAAIQDQLCAASDSQNTAYQLGRGLSESYWALDGATVTSWKWLLGERNTELTRLVGRLSAYFEPLTAPAVSGSLKVWKAVVNDPVWLDAADAVRQLYMQVRRWYGLLVLGQNPQTLIQAGAFLKSWRSTFRAIRVFLPQLIVGVVSFGLLSGLVALLATNSGSATLNALLGASGAFGLSGTVVQTRIKSATNSLAQRLRNEAYADLAAEAITTPPTMPGRFSRSAVRRTAVAVHKQTKRPVINAPAQI